MQAVLFNCIILFKIDSILHEYVQRNDAAHILLF